MAVRTPTNRQEQDEAYNPSQERYEDKFDPSSNSHQHEAANLSQQEKSAYDDILENYNKTADQTKEDANIERARQQESSPDSGWKNNVQSGGAGGSGRFSLKTAASRGGPLAGITALLASLGIMGSVFGPAGAMIHIKELAVNKIDTLTSVISPRADLGMNLRLFGTNGTCAVKIRCRFTGLGEAQMKALTDRGAKLLDGKGEPVKKNALGKYTGGQKLILPSGEAVDASQYKRALRDSASGELRELSRHLFAARYTSWNASPMNKIRRLKRLVTKPDWGEEGEKKGANKAIAKATVGESPGAATQGAPPDPKDKNAVDFGDDAEDINDEVSKLKAQATAGEDIKQIPSDAAGAATMPEFEGKFSAKKGLKSVIGFLNPLDIVSGLCTVYQITYAILIGAQTIELDNIARFASQMVSTSDKMKAGEISGDEAEKSGNMLQQQDEYGDGFGESFTYNYIAYNTIVDKPLTVSASGNDAVRLLRVIMNTVNGIVPGGADTIRTTCGILNNPFVQGALALTSFLPGAGQALSGTAKILAKGGVAEAKKLITEKIAGMITKNITKDALKAASKAAARGLYDLAKGPLAMFLAGYMIERYAVPYIAQMLAGTEFVNADGVKTMDGIGVGTERMNNMVAAESGETPLNQTEYKKFAAHNQTVLNEYIADMRAESNPLDLNNPYSKSNEFLSSLYPILSHFNLSKVSAGQFTSLPKTILSSLSSKQLTQRVMAADQQNLNEELSYCEDEYLQAQKLATSPYCNVKYGFNDITMLNNTDPNAIIDWMLNNKEIDGDGNPVAGSKFADFKTKCVDNASSKPISDLGEEEERLDPMCYGDQNATTQFKMYRLFLIDTRVANAMDGIDDVGDASTGAQTAAASPEICKTMAADDLGQIACHAYQFDPYGYKWGGGHGETTAQAFMAKFKSGGFPTGTPILDCSGLVRMAIYDAFGIETGALATSQYPTYNKFKAISMEEVKAGDILYKKSPGHTEIAVLNDPANKRITTFGAHTDGVAIDKQIGQATTPYTYYTQAYRFIK